MNPVNLDLGGVVHTFLAILGDALCVGIVIAVIALVLMVAIAFARAADVPTPSPINLVELGLTDEWLDQVEGPVNRQSEDESRPA